MTDTPTTWQDKRLKRHFITSPTQFETFSLCKRMWWLKHVRGLEIISSTSQVFGTILHAVCERFLTADDLGNDPRTGRPVDLYPHGWERAYDKHTGNLDGEATPVEQGQIKTLIAAAIAGGVLERLPGRVIEGNIRHTLVKLSCPTCKGEKLVLSKAGDDYVSCPDCKDGEGTHVEITMYLDYELPGAVQDHKTTSNRKYLKSQNAIAKNIQMLIYGHENHLHFPDKEAILLRHNGYIKNPDDLTVRKTEVLVPVKDIEEHWQKIIGMATEMDTLRRTANVWHDIPEPIDQSHACNAYGGCPYRDICSGKESEQGYENRIKKVLSRQANKALPAPGKDQVMASPFAQKLKDRAAANAAANGQASAPVQERAPTPLPPQEQAPASAQQVQQTTPPPASTAGKVMVPWAKSDCPACKGVGFNTKGNPCKICDTTAKQRGVKPSSDYTIVPQGNGMVDWIENADDTNSGTSPMSLTPQAQVKTEEKTTPPPAKVEVPAPLPVQVPKAQEQVPAPAEEQPTASETQAEKREQGRPKKGFMLYINCAIIRGEGRPGSGRRVFHLTEVFTEIANQMATDAKVDSFYQLDAFKRRDNLATAAALVAEQFGADIVEVTGLGSGASDMKAFVDALMPLAGAVTVGVL